jgi:hypothetical protein
MTELRLGDALHDRSDPLGAGLPQSYVALGLQPDGVLLHDPDADGLEPVGDQRRHGDDHCAHHAAIITT